MDFIDGEIEGVIVENPTVNRDSRGWLVEVFRSDELKVPISHAMAYISGTNPSVVRGPHMHAYQTDYFYFTGIGKFNLYLWDYRPDAKRHRRLFQCYTPTVVIVPPGVVHAYKNVSEDDVGLVLNLPNQLYAGFQKKDPVDEVRFENHPGSPFKIEDFPDSE